MRKEGGYTECQKFETFLKNPRLCQRWKIEKNDELRNNEGNESERKGRIEEVRRPKYEGGEEKPQERWNEKFSWERKGRENGRKGPRGMVEVEEMGRSRKRTLSEDVSPTTERELSPEHLSGSHLVLNKHRKMRGCPVDTKEYREGREDGPLKCTWRAGTMDSDPHGHKRQRKDQTIIAQSALDLIGDTPIVKINHIGADENLSCDIFAKCEYFNAGGSIKDRIARRMIEDAEKKGTIKPGDTLIEPTSGNTGIGLALAAAVKGYRMIITLPEKMSNEKVDMLKALGAEIIRTPTEAAFHSPESHIGVAKRLCEEIPNSHILNQYENPSNPLAHYDETAEEIIEQMEGKVDMVVIGAGTGGTITGIGRKLKERIPSVTVIGVDPKGSILAEPEELNKGVPSAYKVEGIGYDFIPTVLDRSIVDSWVKTDDQESFIMARRLIREEGLLVGGSSGSAMVAAVKMAQSLKKGQRCLVILPDSVRNYMSKFLRDEWMYENQMVDSTFIQKPYLNTWWASKRVSELDLQTPLTILPSVSCKDAVDVLTREGYDMVPVVSDDNKILGVVTEGNLTALLVANRVRPDDECSNAMYSNFKQVGLHTPLRDLVAIFDKDHFALVVTTQRCYGGGNANGTRAVVAGVVTRIDLLKYITHGPGSHGTMNPEC